MKTENTNRLTLLTEKLKTLSPDSVLNRGFSIVRKLPDENIITDAADLKSTDRIHITFSKGEKRAEIKE